MEYDENTIGEGSAYAQLMELKDSDFEIGSGDPDITGWIVKTADGTQVGEVSDLLFDPKAMKVRYIILATVSAVTSPGRCVLIPIGLAELHPEDDEVILTGMTREQVGALSAYEGWSKLTAEVESADREVVEEGEQTGYRYPHFYDHAHFDEDRFYGSRTGNKHAQREGADDIFAVAQTERAHRIVEKITHKNDGGSGL